MDQVFCAEFVAHFSSIYSRETFINAGFGPDPAGVLFQSGLAVRRSAGQHARFLSKGCRFDSHGGYICFVHDQK